MVVLSETASGSGVQVSAPRIVAAGKRIHTHGFVRIVRLPLRQRDHLRREAGRSYQVPGASRKRLASALGVDPSGVSRRWGGESPNSPLAKACEEAMRLERAGISSAFMLTRLRINAMLPELLKLSVPELEARIRAELLAEVHADGAADVPESLVLSGDWSDATTDALEAMEEAAAAKKLRIKALLEARRQKLGR